LVPGLVLAARTDHCGIQLIDGVGELAAGVAFVTQQGLAAGTPTAPKQFEPHLALVTFGRGERERTWGPV
jgi:hypothetical protein